MSPLTATDYVWFIMVGLTLGWLLEIILNTFIGSEIDPLGNMAVGTILCIVSGVIGHLIGITSTLLFAGLGTILILFVYNLLSATAPKHHDPNRNEIIIKKKL